MRKILGLFALVLWATLPAYGQEEAGKRSVRESGDQEARESLPETAGASMLEVKPGGQGQDATKGISVSITGTSVSISISLLGLGADVTLGFEEVTGLSLANLGISARLANIFDPGLWNRLPQGTLPVLPLIVRIEPPASGGLTFTGVAGIEIHTHNLIYLPQTPLRFFAAPLGGPFTDITQAMGSGSYRARGTRGGFSEFMILVDLRSVNTVIDSKLDRLDYLLEHYEGSISGPVYDDLAARAAAIRDDFESGATADAIEGVEDFLAEVEAHSGTDIPNVWRAARDVTNVAGYLRETGETLLFSLHLKLGS